MHANTLRVFVCVSVCETVCECVCVCVCVSVREKQREREGDREAAVLRIPFSASWLSLTLSGDLRRVSG